MPLWTNIQRLTRAVTGQGIQNPGPVDLLGPPQTVQVLDDVSHLVVPVSVPVCAGQGLAAAAGAGRHSGVGIQAGAGGALVTVIRAPVVNASFVLTPTVAQVLNLTPIAPTYRTGPAPTSRIFSGDVAAALIAGALGWRHAGTVSNERPNLWAPPGSLIMFVNQTANAQMEFGLMWQEALSA